MMAAPAGHTTTSASRHAGSVGPAADVWWFDVRKVTVGPKDLADLDPRETARAAAFVFPADRHRYQVAHVMLRRVLSCLRRAVRQAGAGRPAGRRRRERPVLLPGALR